ncbi:hypothetical protein HDV57DRAFT_83841 [Trichoderma longibrachiatum]
MSEDICFDHGRRLIVRASFFFISIFIASVLARQRATLLRVPSPFQVFLLFASYLALLFPSCNTRIQSCHRALLRTPSSTSPFGFI